MKVDIYKSTINGTKYLTVPSGTDIQKYEFPSSLDPDLLSLSPFKTSLEITADDNMVALDARQAIDDINKKGFAIHGAKVEIRISVGK